MPDASAQLEAVVPGPVPRRSTSPDKGFAAFREGFAAPWDGFKYMNRYPALWRFAIIPVVINLILTAIVFFALMAGVAWFATTIHPWFHGHWGWRVVEAVVAIALLAAAVGLAIGAWVVLNGILCGHFHGKLALQIELQLGTPRDQLRELSLKYEVADTFYNLGAILLVNTGLLLLNVIPFIGSIIGAGLTFYFDCFIFGLDYLGYPLGLRGMRRSEKRAFARRYRAQTVGLGAVVLLFQFIPVIGSVVLSTAAAGAVLLHRDLTLRQG